MEFSYKLADADPQWVSTYRNLELAPDQRYFITVEVWPEYDKQGKHVRYAQRMKWKRENEAATEWMELEDVEGSQLPIGEYGVALVAHRCQVDFGTVRVTPISDSGGKLR